MTRRTNARLAGFMFLFYIVTGSIGLAVYGSVISGETVEAKLASVREHETLVRSGAVYSLLMMMNPFLLGVALYGLTRDHDHEIALLALLCRVAEGLVAIGAAMPERALLSAAQIAAGPNVAEAAAAKVLGGALLSEQQLTPLIGAAAFAIGSTLFAWIFLRARSIPRWLAWLGLGASLLLVAGLPLQIAGVVKGAAFMSIWIPMALFEVIFGIWLLIKVPSTES